MPVEVTNSDKKENKYSGNKTEHKNGTVQNHRYTPNVKLQELICFSCNQKGHKSNKCIFDKALEQVQRWQCQTFGHYKSNCNVGDKVKTNLLIEHCVRRNIKRCIKTQDHDPGYDAFTFCGQVLNFDGTHTPIKILRDSGSLQSLIASNCAISCDCLDTTDHRLIRGIIKEVYRIPMVEINLCSQLVNGVVSVGVHDEIHNGTTVFLLMIWCRRVIQTLRLQL